VNTVSGGIGSILPGIQEKWAGVETVRTVLAHKGSDVWHIDPAATVYEAIELMADKGVGALLVIKGRCLEGIVSERDYARKVILRGRSSKTTLVADIMTRTLVTAKPSYTVYDCLSIITRARVRHLPVLEGDVVVGIVSIGDLVNSVLSMQAHTINQLYTYLTSDYPT
jgi:CBS domain-containing protein